MDIDNVEKTQEKGMDLKFFDKHYGFAYFVVSKNEINVQFVKADPYCEVEYEFTRYRY